MEAPLSNPRPTRLLVVPEKPVWIGAVGLVVLAITWAFWAGSAYSTLTDLVDGMKAVRVQVQANTLQGTRHETVLRGRGLIEGWE